MKALEWDRLTNISKTVKPYRGTTNRFPIDKRTHNTKCFYVEERNGEQVYVITYGFRHNEHYHTKEEYEANPSRIHHRQWEEDESKMYVSYTPVPRELGIVRSDNTFEFTAPYYGQGDNQIMSMWSRGYFSRSSRHGGMVYGERGSLFHPIFKGMRLNCNTMMPAEGSEYKVVGKRVSRKDAKEFLSGYDDFYKVNEVMFKAMDYKSFMDTVVDVASQNNIDFENWGIERNAMDKLHNFFEANKVNAPLDACCAFVLADDIQQIYRRVRFHIGKVNYGVSDDIELQNLFDNVKRRLNKELYRRNPQCMKLTEHVPNQYYPPSEWGVEITVNGNEVEQY